MRIGELAAASGTPEATLRFYEREGLLPAPHRGANNYRRYGAIHAERLAFIRHCRSLDMGLDEVRELLRLREAPPEDCGAVNALLDRHIDEVAQRITALEALALELRQLRERCQTPQALTDCGILSSLACGGGHSHAAPPAAAPRRARAQSQPAIRQDAGGSALSGRSSVGAAGAQEPTPHEPKPRPPTQPSRPSRPRQP